MFFAEVLWHDAWTIVQDVSVLDDTVYRCIGPPGKIFHCLPLGSYPGFLSFSARLRYPAVFQGAYAASAPVRFYAQQVDEGAYYKVISDTAELAVPGCAAGARRAFRALEKELIGKVDGPAAVHAALQKLGLCTDPKTVPLYLSENPNVFFKEVSMVLQYTFAGMNMGYYPPSKTLPLAKSCDALVAADTDEKSLSALKYVLGLNYLRGKTRRLSGGRKMLVPAVSDDHDDRPAAGAEESSCIPLSGQLPSGPHARITAGDWSGVGAGDDGESWDLQTSTMLVEKIGTNNQTDMFPARSWEMCWLRMHAQTRFGIAGKPGVEPRPTELAAAWGFSSASALVASGASKILFTNGLRDGWSAGGVKETLSEKQELLALNFENGAHHSDLAHFPPDPAIDTPDITAGRAKGADIMAGWLGLAVEGVESGAEVFV